MLSSGKAPSDAPPDDAQQFGRWVVRRPLPPQALAAATAAYLPRWAPSLCRPPGCRFADLYIGDIWSKIEAGLRKEEGEARGL